MRKKSVPVERRDFSLGIGRQTNHPQNALEIVAPIKFDLDAAAFLAVVNRDMGGEVFAQAIFQFA
jgi:hypothetical protein